MKNYRFYLEYASPAHKRRGEHEGNVFALCTESRAPEGLGAVYFRPDSPVAWTGTDYRFLSENCKRVSEQTARTIHPQLFLRLDAQD